MADPARAIWFWKQLPAVDRRRMIWLARRGRPEPDSRVADMGVAWAAAVLAPRVEPRGSLPERLVGFLLSMVGGDVDGEGAGQRWIARRILQANPSRSDGEVGVAVGAWLLDELQFRVGTEALTIEPDRLSDFAEHLADVIVGNVEVLPASKSPANQDKAIWSAIHGAMLGELESQANSEPLTIEPDRIRELVDRLTDVIVGRFELVPRPPRRAKGGVDA